MRRESYRVIECPVHCISAGGSLAQAAPSPRSPSQTRRGHWGGPRASRRTWQKLSTGSAACPQPAGRGHTRDELEMQGFALNSRTATGDTKSIKAYRQGCSLNCAIAVIWEDADAQQVQHAGPAELACSLQPAHVVCCAEPRSQTTRKMETGPPEGKTCQDCAFFRGAHP